MVHERAIDVAGYLRCPHPQLIKLLNLIMATLADELLNDFEDSGSEGEGEKENGFNHDDDAKETNGIEHKAHSVEADVDMDEGGDDEDEDMADEEALHGLKTADTEEEAKSKVEKMKLGGVDDVRSVASLMKTLDPILEVRLPFQTPALVDQGLHP